MEQWDQWLRTLESRIGKRSVDLWLRTLEVTRYDARNLYLNAIDPFQVKWFDEQLADIARREFVDMNGRSIKIHISVNSHREEIKISPEHATSEIKTELALSTLPRHQHAVDSRNHDRDHEPTHSLPNRGGVNQHNAPRDDSHPNLNKRQTHSILTASTPQSCSDLFIEHSGNRLARSAIDTFIKSALDRDPSDWNPLYLYGGAGKSHLLYNYASALSAAGYHPLYTTGEVFTHNVIQAIRWGEMEPFREHHRNVDALIVDNIAHLTQKFSTQEEFFHTFNALHAAGVPIILASREHPQTISGIEERLVSRFEWGLCLEIKSIPTEEHARFMQLLLKQRLQKESIQLSNKGAIYLLKNVGDSPHRLTEAIQYLSWLVERSKLPRNEEITLEQLQNFLENFLKEQQIRELVPEDLLSVVSQHYGIPRKEILGKSQQNDCVIPRSVMAYLCRHLLKMPYKKIGAYLNRDHSTIMTACRKISQSSDGRIKQDIKSVTDQLAKLRQSEIRREW